MEKQLKEKQESLDRHERKLKNQFQLLDQALKECENLRVTYAQAIERLKNTPVDIPQEELTENLTKGLKPILSRFNYKDGTLWNHLEEPVSSSIQNAVGNLQSRMPGAIVKEEKDAVEAKETAMSSTVRRAARELAIDDETLRIWSKQANGDDFGMGF